MIPAKVITNSAFPALQTGGGASERRYIGAVRAGVLSQDSGFCFVLASDSVENGAPAVCGMKAHVGQRCALSLGQFRFSGFCERQDHKKWLPCKRNDLNRNDQPANSPSSQYELQLPVTRPLLSAWGGTERVYNRRIQHLATPECRSRMKTRQQSRFPRTFHDQGA